MINVIYNGIEIPQEDIIDISNIPTEQMKFNFSNIIAAKITLTLRLAETYDDDKADSIFYGQSWYNRELQISDSDSGDVLWLGRVKNISKDTRTQHVMITSTNYVKEIVDADCKTTFGTDGTKTPAEIIYHLLSEVVGIPSEYIRKSSFEDADAIQAANDGYIAIQYSDNDSTKVSSVIQEILRITNSHIYTINNVIYYYQWQPYTEQLGVHITGSDVISGTYNTEFDDTQIYNKYNVVRKNVSNAVYETESTSISDLYEASKTLYGNRVFNVPNDKVDSSLASGFRILLHTEDGANYYGETSLERNSYIKKYAYFETNYDKTYINLAEQIDLSINGMVREPLMVIEKTIDKAKQTIRFKCDFLNMPNNSIYRDNLPPDAVDIKTVQMLDDDTTVIYWYDLPNKPDDFFAYRIEFSRSLNNWASEYSRNALSPIVVASPETYKGVCSYKLYGLELDSVYYFRIVSLDTRLNENVSDIYTFKTYNTTVANAYMLSGDLSVGLQLDDSNPLEGVYSGNTYGSTSYGSAYYEPAAIYESNLMRSQANTIFSKIKIVSELDDIYFQKRTYDGTSYSSWSTEDYVGNGKWFDIDSEYFQCRLLFKSDYWHYDGKVYITEVIES